MALNDKTTIKVQKTVNTAFSQDASYFVLTTGLSTASNTYNSTYNNSWSLGSRFLVNRPILLTHLGTVNNSQSGFASPVNVRLTQFNSALTDQATVTGVAFSGNDYSRSFRGGYRMKELDTPIMLYSGTYQLVWWADNSLVNGVTVVSTGIYPSGATYLITEADSIKILPSVIAISGKGVNPTTAGGSTLNYVAANFGYRALGDYMPFPSAITGTPTLMYTNAQARAITSPTDNTSWFDTSIGITPTSGTGLWNFYAARWNQTIRTTGTATKLASSGFVNISMANTSGLNYFYGGAAYQDPTTKRDLLFLHEEYWVSGNYETFYGTIGLAINSTPNGTSFTRLGTIIAPNIINNNSNTASISQTNLLVKDGFMYVYYADKLSDGTILSLTVARSPLDYVVNSALSGIRPEFNKYYNRTWTQSGINGLATNLDANNNVNSNPFVVYNTNRNMYIKAQTKYVTPGTNNTCRIYLSTSYDGLNWGPESLVENETGEAFYPNIMGTGSDPRVINDAFYVLYTKSALGGFNRWTDQQIKYTTITLTGY